MTHVTHRVNNIGTETVRSVLILNERGTVRSPDVDVHTSLPGTPEIDSQWFSQSRIILESGESLDWVGVNAFVVFVLVSDTHITMQAKNANLKAGMTDSAELYVFQSMSRFRFMNHSEKRATIIAVALL